jgi:hypothetical protein
MPVTSSCKCKRFNKSIYFMLFYSMSYEIAKFGQFSTVKTIYKLLINKHNNIVQ